MRKLNECKISVCRLLAGILPSLLETIASPTPWTGQAKSCQGEATTPGDLRVHHFTYKMYVRHNPSKLKDLPSMLEVFAGRWRELYWDVCRKYGVQPDESTMQ